MITTRSWLGISPTISNHLLRHTSVSLPTGSPSPPSGLNPRKQPSLIITMLEDDLCMISDPAERAELAHEITERARMIQALAVTGRRARPCNRCATEAPATVTSPNTWQ